MRQNAHNEVTPPVQLASLDRDGREHVRDTIDEAPISSEAHSTNDVALAPTETAYITGWRLYVLMFG